MSLTYVKGQTCLKRKRDVETADTSFCKISSVGLGDPTAPVNFGLQQIALARIKPGKQVLKILRMLRLKITQARIGLLQRRFLRSACPLQRKATAASTDGTPGIKLGIDAKIARHAVCLLLGNWMLKDESYKI